MNILIQFFNTVLYQPLLNVLILLYVYVPGHDFGVAVIGLTLLIKLILSPTSLKAIRSQKALAEIQPRLKELQNRYKDNKAKQSRAVMELYQKAKVSPVSGCLPLLLQLPILLALYQVFLKGLKPEILKANIYDFVPIPDVVNLSFIGLLDLTRPSLVLALLAGALQFIQTKISMISKSTSSQTKKTQPQLLQSQMLYFFPILTVFLVWRLGAVVGLYWAVSTLFSIGEQYIINSKFKQSSPKGEPVALCGAGKTTRQNTKLKKWIQTKKKQLWK